MLDLTGLDLPQSVLDLIELDPVEDLLLAVLRDGFPDVPVYSLIPEEIPAYFMVVRRMPGIGDYQGDPRGLTDWGRLYVHTFTSDPDGDEKGAVLQEAVRVVMRNAWLSHRVFAGLGSIARWQMVAEPTRKTDWANSTGPVQFADLPTGYWRYESIHEVEVRKPF